MALAPMMMLAQSKRVLAAARRNKQPLFNTGMGFLTFFLAGHGFKQQMQLQEFRQLVTDTRAEVRALRDRMASDEWSGDVAAAVLAAGKDGGAAAVAEACTSLIEDTLVSAGVGKDSRESQAWRRLEGTPEADPMDLAMGRAQLDLPPPPKDLESATVPEPAAGAAGGRNLM
uniref:Uncharacterized protein n=1 Tax=Bicosoecida sp. CB-2014 TaxID=1486930 RepID=A0A7S1C3F7_9STRA|mmetsp:Transcript_12283/g.43095  ORF Transcript_12283/g.43095 Transcript_12283/m.43095 type:complete len:172 (+) Transcript_12283:327-842(+)